MKEVRQNSKARVKQKAGTKASPAKRAKLADPVWASINLATWTALRRAQELGIDNVFNRVLSARR
jgi:hypothetical protein